MDALIELSAPDDLKGPAKEAFNGLDVDSLTEDNFLDMVSACGRHCVAKCPNSSAVVEVEGFVVEVAAQLWLERQFKSRCPLRDLLSRLRVCSEFGPRECAFMTKYFYYFGKMRSHEGMMNDLGRSETYRDAILGNPDDFKGKVVMDVGSGSGLLAFFAIQAGAEKVYAVEAGCMHGVISTLARANGWGDKVIVINKVLQDMTEADCPLNSVDTMIAETLGTFLFGERGIETMLVARDRFLKPGGAIFPTQATLSLAPFSDEALYVSQSALPAFWSGNNFMGIDLSSCHERANQEQMSQVVSSMVDPSTLVAKQHDVVYDFRTLDSAALRNIKLSYDFTLDRDANVHGLAGWFIADFIGANATTRLSTAPEDILTHWFQVRFLVPKMLLAKTGESLTGTMNMQANEQQSYTCSMDMVLQSYQDGDQRRQNSDMGLMDLDMSHKKYAYKFVTHGNVRTGCVDWQKTTEEARKNRAAAQALLNGTPSKHWGKTATLKDIDFMCVNAPEKLVELKIRQRVIMGKIGDDAFQSVKGDTSAGLIRRDGNGEESFWMQKDDCKAYMIEHIVVRKAQLQVSYQKTPDDELRKHFEGLELSQICGCFEKFQVFTSVELECK